MQTALLVVQFLNAIAVLGGNVVLATDKVSAMLQKKHLAGEELTRDELFALMDEGDVLEAQYLARAKEAMERQQG